MARGLGWASIAIGLTEIMATKQVQQLIGVKNQETAGMLKVLGAREIASGVDILAHDDPTPGVWSRVIGDAMDLILLGAASRKTRNPGGLTTAFAMVIGITLLDVLFSFPRPKHWS
jgi:hypothetical protein